MVNLPERKVGIVSCSGEGCVEGTVSRIATRLVLEKIHPENTVTICLPLFLAGGKEERAFARDYPTIAVDGCDRLCAKTGTERHSGKIASSIVVTELTNGRNRLGSGSRRKLSDEDLTLAESVAEKIAQEVDKILNRWR
jgi:uncharacterized metal-binding protein